VRGLVTATSSADEWAISITQSRTWVLRRDVPVAPSSVGWCVVTGLVRRPGTGMLRLTFVTKSTPGLHDLHRIRDRAAALIR
jgi:hypothetical protein